MPFQTSFDLSVLSPKEISINLLMDHSPYNLFLHYIWLSQVKNFHRQFLFIEVYWDKCYHCHGKLHEFWSLFLIQHRNPLGKCRGYRHQWCERFHHALDQFHDHCLNEHLDRLSILDFYYAIFSYNELLE